MEKVLKKNLSAPVSTSPSKAPQSEREGVVKKKKDARTKHNSVSSNDEGDENQDLIQPLSRSQNHFLWNRKINNHQ